MRNSFAAAAVTACATVSMIGGLAMAQENVCTQECCAGTPVNSEPAVACTITDAALMEERREKTRHLVETAKETVETENGYKLKFDRSMASELFDYAQFESQCCTFIEFSLTWERGRASIWLELAGSSDQAKAVIREMVDQTED